MPFFCHTQPCQLASINQFPGPSRRVAAQAVLQDQLEGYFLSALANQFYSMRLRRPCRESWAEERTRRISDSLRPARLAGYRLAVCLMRSSIQFCVLLLHTVGPILSNFTGLEKGTFRTNLYFWFYCEVRPLQAPCQAPIKSPRHHVLTRMQQR